MRYDKDKDAYIITNNKEKLEYETAKAGYCLVREFVLGCICGIILGIIHFLIKFLLSR